MSIHPCLSCSFRTIHHMHIETDHKIVLHHSRTKTIDHPVCHSHKKKKMRKTQRKIPASESLFKRVAAETLQLC